MHLQTKKSTEISKQRREAIIALENELLKHDQIDIPIKHYHAHGLYAREMTVPAGVILTGKIHKTEHINVLSKGKVLVVSEFLEEEMIAPHTFVAEPGSKRAIHAIEDSVWTNFHHTFNTDLDKIESELIAGSYEELADSQSEGK